MSKANVAITLQTKLEMMIGCALDSGSWNEGLIPGGGGAAPIISRTVTADCSNGSLKDMATANVGTRTHWRYFEDIGRTLAAPGRVVLRHDICVASPAVYVRMIPPIATIDQNIPVQNDGTDRGFGIWG